MRVTHRMLERWSAALLAVTGVLVVLNWVAFFTLRHTAYHEWFVYFSLAGELGIAAYFNAALLAFVGAVAGLSGVLSASRPVRRGWFVLAGVALLMSIDEATRLHERTVALIPGNPLRTSGWLLIGIPLAIGLVVVLYLASRSLPPTTRRALGIALAAYLVGAVGFEALSGYYWGLARPRVSGAFGTIEEVLEMTACIYAIHVIVRGLLPLHVTPRAVDRSTPQPDTVLR
jgi:hypothetical protein